jgi:hypothetical protein
VAKGEFGVDAARPVGAATVKVDAPTRAS